MSAFLAACESSDKAQGDVFSGMNNVVSIINEPDRCVDGATGFTHWLSFHPTDVGAAIIPI